MVLDRFHSSDVHINENLDFSSLVSNPLLLKGLTESGYQRPSPIQLKTIPMGRLGLDMVAQAKSGTGKTVVFSIIAIESVLSQLPKDLLANITTSNSSSGSKSSQQQYPRAVIIAPTREIAVQIQDVIVNILQGGLNKVITCVAMIGGMPIQKDKENLKRCSIIVGTPGRVHSLVETGHLDTSHVRLFVMDEADKLMEDLYRDDVFKICKGLGSKKQVMAFSATYDDDLLAHLDKLVKNPVYVMLTNGTPELEGVLQFYKTVKLSQEQQASSVFMRQTHLMEAKFAELEGIFTHTPFYQAIVFLNHTRRATDLVKFLARRGWPAMHIASGISQIERLAIMEKARKFELRVLVCSDLIARGIDIDRVNLVVNMDLPRDPETYLHRIGRTGRYGTTGLAVSIVDDTELKTIEILKNDFSISLHQLLDEDKTYSELGQWSKNRHHERPLQVAADQEQFKLLEATRKDKEREIQNAGGKVELDGVESDRAVVSQQEIPKKKRPLEPAESKEQMATKRKEFSMGKKSKLGERMPLPSLADSEQSTSLTEPPHDETRSPESDRQDAENDEDATCTEKAAKVIIESYDHYTGNNTWYPPAPDTITFPYFSPYYPYSHFNPCNPYISYVPPANYSQPPSAYPHHVLYSHYYSYPQSYSFSTPFLPPDLPLFPYGPSFSSLFR
ncbi:DEAD (Asp-Glu-Ala-Asp) box polypeptide 20 [Linnemannia schmuckeri]|uniref:RNA helicase n=1 Tax=Linnemannia schmuckeri TaxID=64567 RepID=A0A9P5S1W1_9FUNG|nr:DEAD (Asp-Glu-Ala-Asp) box polypeptide 20 [Linnemannia schmuckeri]